MTRLGNPLVYDLLTVAEELTRASGTGSQRKAALRRAVSTADYAVFHALCYVCADSLVGWSKSEVMVPIYRSLDHGSAKTRLASAEAKALLEPQGLDVGAAFTFLEEKRHEADYAAPSLTVSKAWARDCLERAQQTIAIIETLDRTQRMKLAVLLIAKPRSR
jgi:hypothetical protein